MSKMINKVLIVPCSASPEKDFFTRWVEYLKPRHGLTNREQEVFAAFLRNRHELSLGITDKNILEEVCLNEANRDKIRKSLGMSSPQLNAVISKLKERKLLKAHYDNGVRVKYYEISPSFIPDVNLDEPFALTFVFMKDAEKGTIEPSSE